MIRGLTTVTAAVVGFASPIAIELPQACRNTISALGGMPVRDAMVGLATGNRNGKPAQREQTVYTPVAILQVPRALGPIGLDPCSGPGSIVGALEAWQGTQVQAFKADGSPRVKRDGTPVFKWIGPGLTESWQDRGLVYVNPPYENLREWLAKAMAEARSGAEIILLGPVRPQRKWWRASWFCADARGWLDPVTFEGYAQSFRAPLCLWYWGPRVDEFRRAFEAANIGELDE